MTNLVLARFCAGCFSLMFLLRCVIALRGDEQPSGVFPSAKIAIAVELITFAVALLIFYVELRQ